MPVETIVAAVGLAGVIAYAVLGGADFGGGVWDLFASGPRKQQQREAIAHAMGPVWEANHVWLIFVNVVLFTAFPPAYAALSVGLFLPFHLVLLGIILRGTAFVFRTYSRRAGLDPGRAGVVFGAASVVTPVLLGMCLGAVSSGELRVSGGQVWFDGRAPWLTPLALMTGAATLALFAYLAAVYLTNETDGDLREDFRRRALFAGTFVVALSVLLLPVLVFDAPYLAARLLSPQSAPVLAAGAAAALLSGWFLLTRRYRSARAAAVAQVVLLLVGWGLAQYPYVVYPDLTLAAAKAPDATLWFVLLALPFGAALLVPSLWLLFAVFKGQRAGNDDGPRGRPAGR